MEMKPRAQAIQEVQLKSGKTMNYMKDKNNRHVFFGDLYAMNIWMVMMLVFILLTSIVMSYWTISTVAATYNMALVKLTNIEQRLGISQGDNTVTPIAPDQLSPTSMP